MKKHLRLLGAFFLLIICSSFSFANQNEIDYSLSVDRDNVSKFIIVNNSDTTYPSEVIDYEERSIRYRNVGSDAIPIASLVLSILSFVFAIFVPIYLDYKSKNKSVLDDFWARQVFYPDYFKPFLEYSYWLKTNINQNFNEKTSEKLNEYDADFINKYKYLKNLLGAIDINFDQIAFDQKNNQIQDLVGKYVNLLSADLITIIKDKRSITMSFDEFLKENITSNKHSLLEGYKNNINMLVDDMTKDLLNIVFELQGKKLSSGS